MLRLHRKDEETITLNITNRTVVRVLMLVLAWILVLASLRRAEHALLLVFTSFFLALALNAPVFWLSKRLPGKRRGSRSLATAISFFVVIALLIGFIASIAPPLTRQTENFISADRKSVV